MERLMKKCILCIYVKTKLTKWGNSYAIRIPKQIVDQMELSNESELRLTSKENSFIISKPSKDEQLAELIKNIKPQKEIDWGPPRGKEVW
jgi:antitoxin MazE